ncbi:glycosyltransferase family 2 protein [Flavobacterium algoritolerans]|uniref:Glycosyltransferase family 2 protein n=1 Tax=Flavobacterium algoritolerans TaxID=3041254 RepID=A0ABT6VBI5_9FLAO|nr:glycosyltransferase family 2 protein [Flavobacterium algoritolerans]MDI5895577.1 glycosyltransferase family 2 protein [Flavobacterium algoritolerans]
MKPKISIITINYNNLEGLQKTIESVSSQTWQAFEHIIIDGGSSDGSVAYIESKSDQFAYWVSDPDKGVYHAMNKGIAQASGDYLLFLNSGDHFFSTKVLEQNHEEIKNVAIIYFNLQVVEGHKVFIKEYPELLSFSYFVKDTLPHPATFIAKEAFEKTNLYSEDFKILSDWKFFLDSICKYNLTYKKMNTTLSTFYIGGMSSNPANRAIKQAEKQQVLQQDYAAFVQDLDDVILYKEIVTTFRKSRIIRLLVKLRLLNQF